MFAYCQNNPVLFADTTGYRCIPALHNTREGFLRESGSDIENSPGDKIAKRKKELDPSNTDEQVVLGAKFAAFYKGTLVIWHSIPLLTSWASCGVIFLNNNIRDSISSYQEQTLRHEYGHILQEKEMGSLMYGLTVFIPSVAGNVMYRIDRDQPIGYYDLPWEYDADIRGNVNREHSWTARYLANYYFAFWGQ